MIYAVRCGLAALALSAMLPAAAAGAAEATYKAALSGASEVPANATTGTGEVTATYDPASRTLSWSGTYGGLSGPVTAAHFHGPAEAGKNAGVLIPVTASASPFTGSVALDEAKAADLMAGRLYFNIHTGENPKGEIRGQVERAPYVSGPARAGPCGLMLAAPRAARGARARIAARPAAAEPGCGSVSAARRVQDPNAVDPNDDDANVLDANDFDPNVLDPNVLDPNALDPNALEMCLSHLPLKARALGLAGLRTAALVAALAAALPGAAQAANVFRFAFQGDIKSLDPYSLKESFTIGMHGAAYESLITRDKTLKLAPQLAESWETPEPTRWRFHLRRGVKFHDGSDFTADDVLFSAARVRASGSNFQTNVPADAEFVRVDDHTVDMVLKKPNPIALFQFSTWYIMSKSWAEKNGATAPSPASAASPSYAALHENGTGPFVITEHQPGVRTVFKKFPGYWGKTDSNLDEAVFTTIGNAATRVAALLSGEVDWIDPVPLQDQSRVEASGTASVMAGPELRTVFLGMDQWRDELKDASVKGRNPFKDPRVREAFYLAIDEDTIAKRVMRGQATPSALLIAPSLVNGGDAFKRPASDTKRAKALLTEAGYPDGFAVTMDCPNDRYVNDEAICQAVVSMLARVGVKVNLNAQPKAKYFAKVLAPGYDTSFYLVGWTPSSNDSHNILYEIAGCRGEGKSGRGGWNLGNYCSAKVDALADRVESETDDKARDAAIKEGFDTIQADWGFIPLHQQALAWGVSKKVTLVQRPDNMLMLYWVSKQP